jgi:hypothetical protein
MIRTLTTRAIAALLALAGGLGLVLMDRTFDSEYGSVYSTERIATATSEWATEPEDPNSMSEAFSISH